jgi:hypothetical protein
MAGSGGVANGCMIGWVCLTTTSFDDARRESRPGTIVPITLGTKQTGASSAGNLYAGCDVAGADAAHYVPGIYVGADAILDAATLRHSLKFVALLEVLEPSPRHSEELGITPEKAARWRNRFLDGGIAVLRKDRKAAIALASTGKIRPSVVFMGGLERSKCFFHAEPAKSTCAISSSTMSGPTAARWSSIPLPLSISHSRKPTRATAAVQVRRQR